MILFAAWALVFALIAAKGFGVMRSATRTRTRAKRPTMTPTHQLDPEWPIIKARNRGAPRNEALTGEAKVPGHFAPVFLL